MNTEETYYFEEREACDYGCKVSHAHFPDTLYGLFSKDEITFHLNGLRMVFKKDWIRWIYDHIDQEGDFSINNVEDDGKHDDVCRINACQIWKEIGNRLFQENIENPNPDKEKVNKLLELEKDLYLIAKDVLDKQNYARKDNQ